MLKNLFTVRSDSKFLLAPVTILLIAASFVFLILQINSGYNWDMDHLIYSGSRLLEGELIWVLEYEDKLPFVSFLFSLVAYFGTILAWIPFVLFFIFCGMASTYCLIYEISKDISNEVNKEPSWFAISGAVFLLAALIFAPESIYHISGISSCASLTVFALILKISLSKSGISTKNTIYYLLAILFASFAMSLRPYLGLVILLGSFWAITYLDTTKKKKFLYWIIWCSFTGIVTISINFLPYIISNNIESVFSGLAMLSQKLNPQNPLSILQKLYGDLFIHTPLITLMCTVNLFFILYISILKLKNNLLMSRNLSNHQKIFIKNSIFFCFILPCFIVLMFLNKHFFHHYVQMFIPFLSVGMGLFFCFFSVSIDDKIIFFDNKILGIALGMVILSSLPGSWKNLRKIDENKEIIVSNVQAIVKASPFEVEGFFMPENVYVHWRLKEPRYGFPHAANTRHILKGWWESALIPDYFDIPTNIETYCSRLNKLINKYIILDTDSKLNSCFEAQKSGFLQKQVKMKYGPDLYFYLMQDTALNK
jgi:hypothetical protein